MGNNLVVETTSLAVIDWLNIDAGKFSANIELSVGYLLKAVKDGGRYGSTQATILCLKALVNYSKVFGGVKGSGSFVLSVNNQELRRVNFDVDSSTVSNVDFSDDLQKAYSLIDTSLGMDVKIEIDGYTFDSKDQGFRLSYLLQVDYINREPPTAEDAPIKFELGYDKELETISELGDVQQQTVTVDNLSGKAQGMLVSILSVPACMSVEQAQLELLKDSGSVNNYEVSADSTLITLYWTYLKEGEQKKVTISRVKTFAGEICNSRASQTFLYYADDKDVWVK